MSLSVFSMSWMREPSHSTCNTGTRTGPVGRTGAAHAPSSYAVSTGIGVIG